MQPYVWEHGVALQFQTSDEVLSLLDYPGYFDLMQQALPDNKDGILDRLKAEKLITPDADGHWNITNLGAILFAKDLACKDQQSACPETGSFRRLLRRQPHLPSDRPNG